MSLALSLALAPSAALAGPVQDPPVADPAPQEGSFRLPALVRGGDAFVVRMPMQWGLIAYRPRVRIELGWAHQLGAKGRRGPRVHWLSFGASALLDRARRHIIAPQLHAVGDDCGGQACRGGTVAGANLAVGYRYMPTFDKKPWLAPVVHGAVNGGPWFYPSARVQTPRTWTAQVGLELGAGLRIFLTERIAVGADLDLQLDLLIHEDRAGRPQFGLGLGVFPVVFEIRR